jgi:2',3'-cyclic-nucleotide 2'-phosphodiesterase (5'-nucleotidase family)
LPTIEIAAKLTRQLREDQNADFVIALTHLSLVEDRAILKVLGEAGPDMIAGGHEHARLISRDTRTGRRIYKADAEARSASVFELNVNTAELQHQFVTMDETIEPDPLVQARVDSWLTRHEDEFCSVPGCLSQVLAVAGNDLIAEELEIRMFETNFGNYVLDLALNAFANEQADFAVMNSGGLRLNQNISAGSVITQRHIEELIAYPTTLFLVEVSGETIFSMLTHSVDRWSGNGWFLQVSGISFTQDPESGSVSEVQLANGTPIDRNGKYKMVVNDYLLNPRYDQDGYTMLSADMMISNRMVDLRDLLLDDLDSHAEIAPTLSGRICNPGYRPENCTKH